MEKVKLTDFKIVPDINSVHKEEIDDNTYFSDKYAHYISNSGLKWINPLEGGSPQLFKHHPKLSTQSLKIGSAVHECLLQPESFELAPKLGNPGSKLGLVLDEVPTFLKDGVGLDDAIKQAALKIDYYSKTIETKIDSIKEIWFPYSKNLEELNKIPTDKERIIVSDKEWDVVDSCLKSCQKNEEIMSKLHPTTPFGDPVLSFCEDAFFMDFIVIYKRKQCAILKFKMKADNWTIDFDEKVLTLNDLKTTGKSVNIFMNPDNGSFNHYNYARQMAVYSQILWYYAMKQFGISKENGWKLKANMLVVETIPNYWSRSYYVSESQLKEGRKMLNELLCRVAYCEMFGYDKEIEFI
jgi:hypothetical protein